MTWWWNAARPTITFEGEMTLWMGKVEVRFLQLGAGHTRGDMVVWLPEESQKVNAKLILLLANQVGDQRVLDETLAYVRSSLNK